MQRRFMIWSGIGNELKVYLVSLVYFVSLVNQIDQKNQKDKINE